MDLATSMRPLWFVTEGEDSAKADAMVEGFVDKYGACDVEAYYPKRDVAVEVPPA